jgi:Ribose/xylose/arabinose/galactoside ABC-type transport systems, permease components
MQRWLKGTIRKNEFYIFVTIIIIGILIQIRSGQFFTANNFVDLANAMIVPGLFALGAFLVIVSGGIDVSFPALASLSVFVTTKVLLGMNYTGSILVPILMVAAVGVAFGSLNGFIIAKFGFPAFVVTLGTQSVFRGILQGALNAVTIYKLPDSMNNFGDASIFSVQNPVSGLISKMPLSFIVLVAAVIIIFWLLRYTMFGRGIYAIGGNESSAQRAGFNVFRIKFSVYIITGLLASVTGLIRTCQIGQFQTTNLFGMEMTIIASVVLGGTAITGGKGSITGALLGTFLIVLVQNSLILLGVSTTWQGLFLGVLIIIGTGISALQVDRANNKIVGLKDV